MMHRCKPRVSSDATFSWEMKLCRLSDNEATRLQKVSFDLSVTRSTPLCRYLFLLHTPWLCVNNYPNNELQTSDNSGSTLTQILHVLPNSISHKHTGSPPIWRQFTLSRGVTRVRFLPLARSKLRLCSVNHRAGYFSNLACDWLSIVWTYSGLYRQTNLSNLLLNIYYRDRHARLTQVVLGQSHGRLLQ